MSGQLTSHLPRRLSTCFFQCPAPQARDATGMRASRRSVQTCKRPGQPGRSSLPSSDLLIRIGRSTLFSDEWAVHIDDSHRYQQHQHHDQRYGGDASLPRSTRRCLCRQHDPTPHKSLSEVQGIRAPSRLGHRHSGGLVVRTTALVMHRHRRTRSHIGASATVSRVVAIGT